MKLGYPRLERERVIAERVAKHTISTFPLEVFNTVHQLPVIEVPIELLKYRLQNGRTASLQLEDIAQNNLPPDFYRSDIESVDSQRRQHDLLRKLVESDHDLTKAFEKEKKKQLDPLIIDPKGFVVNGNRRLCFWRQLLDEDPKEYGHFQIVKVAVLPDSITDAEIRKIESRLQLQPDLRDDYTWHAQANMYQVLMKELDLDSKGVADTFDLSKPQIEMSLRMLTLGAEYLTSRGIANQWSFLDNKEFGFRRLVLEEKNVQSLLDKEILHASAFLVIDGSEEFGDRAWALIPKIKTSIADWKQTVVSTFKPEGITNTGPADITNPFVKGAKPVVDVDARVASLLRNADAPRRAQLKDTLAEFLEDVTDKEDEVNRSLRLLKSLKMGLGDIKAAAEHGLVNEAQLNGVAETIGEIHSYLETISNWLKTRSH